MAKAYDWKRLGKQGSHSVRFQFSDEARGEHFFDMNFGAGMGSKAGKLEIQGRLDYNNNPVSSSAETDFLRHSLRKGTQVTMHPSWVSPKGTKSLKPVTGTITGVERGKYGLEVSYSEGLSTSHSKPPVSFVAKAAGREATTGKKSKSGYQKGKRGGLFKKTKSGKKVYKKKGKK